MKPLQINEEKEKGDPLLGPPFYSPLFTSGPKPQIPTSLARKQISVTYTGEPKFFKSGLTLKRAVGDFLI